MVVELITDKSIRIVGGQVNQSLARHHSNEASHKAKHQDKQYQSDLEQSWGKDPPPRPVDVIGELKSYEEDCQKG